MSYWSGVPYDPESRQIPAHIDEISIRKGHTYRIVVSDLIRRRPIWFDGTDHSEASLALFFNELGMKKCQGIYLAVMDMWKPFRNATIQHVPKASAYSGANRTPIPIQIGQ